MANNLKRNEPAADGQQSIACVDKQGALIPVASTELAVRVAVYGLLLERERILLQKDARSELLHPPGGLIPPSQAPTTILRQLFRAATGLAPAIGQLILLDDTYRWEAYQGIHIQRFFYLIQRQPNTPGAFIDYDNPAQPRWVKLDQLDKTRMLLGYQASLAAAAWLRDPF